jgi:hypothetical protein
VLEKVLGVSAMRSCPYLGVKPSQLEADVDRISYPLRHPTACGCRPNALRLWFGNIHPCLVAKPFFGGVTALTGIGGP